MSNNALSGLEDHPGHGLAAYDLLDLFLHSRTVKLDWKLAAPHKLSNHSENGLTFPSRSGNTSQTCYLLDKAELLFAELNLLQVLTKVSCRSLKGCPSCTELR